MPVLAAFALANLKRDIEAVIAWLSHRSFWQLVSMGLAAFALLLHFQLAATRHSRDAWKRQFEHSEQGRHADREAYVRGQKQAQALNQQQVERAKSQQQRINDATVSNLNARLERLRDELRKGGTAAPQSHPIGPGPGNPGNSAPGASGEAGVCLTPEELLRAAESEERHDRLIDWVIEQSKVDPNK